MLVATKSSKCVSLVTVLVFAQAFVGAARADRVKLLDTEPPAYCNCTLTFYKWNADGKCITPEQVLNVSGTPFTCQSSNQVGWMWIYGCNQTLQFWDWPSFDAPCKGIPGDKFNLPFGGCLMEDGIPYIAECH